MYNATAKSGDGVKIWTAIPEPKFNELLTQWTSNATSMLPMPGSDLQSTIAAEIKAMILARKYAADDKPALRYRTGKVFHDCDAMLYHFQARTLRNWLTTHGVKARAAEIANAFEELGGYVIRSTVKIDSKPEHPWTVSESTVEGWRT